MQQLQPAASGLSGHKHTSKDGASLPQGPILHRSVPMSMPSTTSSSHQRSLSSIGRGCAPPRGAPPGRRGGRAEHAGRRRTRALGAAAAQHPGGAAGWPGARGRGGGGGGGGAAGGLAGGRRGAANWALAMAARAGRVGIPGPGSMHLTPRLRPRTRRPSESSPDSSRGRRPSDSGSRRSARPHAHLSLLKVTTFPSSLKKIDSPVYAYR